MKIIILLRATNNLRFSLGALQTDLLCQWGGYVIYATAWG